MNLHVPAGTWDIALVLVVSAQCTIIAYLHQPRWKALVLSLPFPFTLASLALGEPVNSTHIAGLIVFLAFTYAVKLLHYNARVPIVPAIAASAVGYCIVGSAAAALLPRTDTAFWTVAAAALSIAALLFIRVGHRDEPGHKSPLPLWMKLPIIIGVITSLILLKQVLHGFMAVFPMVGLITAYEARHSLRTICRQVPAMLLALVPMIATVRLTQHALGLGPALGVGWAAFAAILAIVLSWRHIADTKCTNSPSQQPQAEITRKEPDAN